MTDNEPIILSKTEEESSPQNSAEQLEETAQEIDRILGRAVRRGRYTQ